MKQYYYLNINTTLSNKQARRHLDAKKKNITKYEILNAKHEYEIN